jgi:hypothetical protein
MRRARSRSRPPGAPGIAEVRHWTPARFRFRFRFRARYHFRARRSKGTAPRELPLLSTDPERRVSAPVPEFVSPSSKRRRSIAAIAAGTAIAL